MKKYRPCLCETRDKWLLGRESDRSWCHRHATSIIKLFWSQCTTPWTSVEAYGQGEKFITDEGNDWIMFHEEGSS